RQRLLVLRHGTRQAYTATGDRAVLDAQGEPGPQRPERVAAPETREIGELRRVGHVGGLSRTELCEEPRELRRIDEALAHVVLVEQRDGRSARALPGPHGWDARHRQALLDDGEDRRRVRRATRSAAEAAARRRLVVSWSLRASASAACSRRSQARRGAPRGGGSGPGGGGGGAGAAAARSGGAGVGRPRRPPTPPRPPAGGGG